MKEDFLRRFLFEDLGVRGEWVHLSESWQLAKQHQHYATHIESLLGQALAAAVLLSATIKFKGSMILQAQGDGAIKTLVAQASDQRKIRGLIRCDANTANAPLHKQFGRGRLVLTVASENADPYQGIIPLQANSLAANLEHYFQQSEQLNTRVWLFADGENAAGLLLQQLPAVPHKKMVDWERVELLANTITQTELLSLDCETLLYRLFNEEKVRLFAAEAIEFECSCSRPRIERTLQAMGSDELYSILQEREIIEIICEFCNAQYLFDRLDVAALLAKTVQSSDVNTLH
ncbi:MAG: Hsp33 family molecular chaperone HslO [Methylococcaceae bacterium]